MRNLFKSLFVLLIAAVFTTGIFTSCNPKLDDVTAGVFSIELDSKEQAKYKKSDFAVVRLYKSEKDAKDDGALGKVNYNDFTDEDLSSALFKSTGNAGEFSFKLNTGITEKVCVILEVFNIDGTLAAKYKRLNASPDVNVIIRASQLVTFEEEPEVTVERVELNVAHANIYQSSATGKITSTEYSVIAFLSDGSNRDVTSEAAISQSPEVLELCANGLIQAGDTVCDAVKLVATYQGVNSESVTVKVNAKDVVVPDPVLASVVISSSTENYSINQGETKDITVTALAKFEDGSTKDVTSNVTFSSSNSTVISVSGSTLTLKSAGTSIITCAYTAYGVTKNGSKSITVTENVLPPDPDDEPALPVYVSTAYDGVKIMVDKTSNSSYGYIWYWSVVDQTGTPMAEYPDSGKEIPEKYTWGNFESLSIEGNYYVKEFKGAAGVSFLIVTASGTKLYTTGNDAADGWTITEKGIYIMSSTTATKQDEGDNGPRVTIDKPDGYSFNKDTMNVTISAVNSTTAKYTVDGSAPWSSSTAVSFAGTKTITLGADMAVNDSVTLRVYADNGEFHAKTSATYTKDEIIEDITPTRLGAHYTSTGTTFTIWSPDSSNVVVEVTPKGGTMKSYTCQAGFTVNGNYPDQAHIYGVTVPGDLHLAEYQFKVGGKYVRDPYGKMVKYEDEDAKTNLLEANFSYTGQPYPYTMSAWEGSMVNIVLDMDKTEPADGWAERPALANRQNSIVYEVHVGDFTASPTWTGTEKNRGKFPGFVETGTTYTKDGVTVTTGIDHLKELGVTHVQIMPIYDFATKLNNDTGEIYNWGYDPINYNVPEDRYSTCPSDYVERVRELKTMINELHKNGIRVVMDVVYNHTYGQEVFDKITKKYYTASDMSGCGNSINTAESTGMVSRMIRDSLEYWATEYNIDGFRFDLMAIYTNAAVKDWGTFLNSHEDIKDRNLLMYGEPWQANNNNSTSYAYCSSMPELETAKIGCFAGKFRESIKGGNDDAEAAYIFNQSNKAGEPWAIEAGLKGSLTSVGSDYEGVWTRYYTSKTYQAINYISAHDNLCLFDKILTVAAKDANYSKPDYQRQILNFGDGIVLISQGIPFIHAGDDFCRSKLNSGYEKASTWAHNSYQWGTLLNQINWADKITYNSNFKYHKDLIALRKANDGFTNGNCTTSISGRSVTYTVRNSNGTTLTCYIDSANGGPALLGTEIFNASGATPASGITGASGTAKGKCEGTAITIYKK